MTATLAGPRRGVYRKPASIPVTPNEVADVARMLASYGKGHEWNAPQPQALAYTRENVARGKSALPLRVYLLLLWNGSAQKVADYVGAKRREKLGQSRAKDIPALIVTETEHEAVENVLEARVLAGVADRAEKVACAERMRDHARDLIELADALADAAHGSEATV